MKYAFPKSKRLCQRHDFVRLQKRKKTFVFPSVCSYIALDWLKTSLNTPRLGITVTRKQGSSVQRNIFKRRVREAFRQSSLATLPLGCDIQVRPQGVAMKGEKSILDRISYQEILLLFKEFDHYIRKNMSSRSGSYQTDERSIIPPKENRSHY